jgi:adenosylhomocysteine nucleosidase
LKKLICFALKEEAAPFQKLAADNSEISILLTGIGRRNAEKSVREFLAVNSPTLVLTCGFAGALNPELKIGDVVFEISNTFSSRSRVDETQIKNQSETPHVVSYNELLAAGAKPAKFACADRIATTAAEKKKLRDATGADAVEMESATICALCDEKKIPSATMRVISDTAQEDLPLDFNALMTADQKISSTKLAMALMKSPGVVPRLLKLQRDSQFAAERLAEVLQRLLNRRSGAGGD